MAKVPNIGEVMTHMPHSIGLDQSVKQAKELMRKYNIRHLPVQEGGRLVGIATDRDINFALGVDLKTEYELYVRDVYTPDPYTVSPSTSLEVVVSTMSQDHIGSVLVVDHGKLVGIFTAVDACRLLGDYLRNV